MSSNGKTLLLFGLLFLFVTANAENLNQKVIYGDDNRKDIYEVNDSQLLNLADSTVALVDASQFMAKGGGYTNIKAEKYGDAYALCKDEPFYDQPTGAFCSGFLVNDDTIVTAGHCIRNQESCEDVKFVFGFAVKSINDGADTVKENDVYGCKQLIHTEVKGNGADFAVIKLDRKVKNHTPLKLRKKGSLAINEAVTVIGHPAGIPTKIADGAQVRSIENGFFNTNLDTYGGNSGSAVFNSTSGEVEGILVRGATDFVFKDGCRKSNVCKDDECRGEDVTLISEVLKYL